MPRKSKKQQLDEIHSEAMKRFRDCEEAEDDERELARDDMVFATVGGQQYDQRYERNRSRPRYEINKIHHAINQVIGEFCQNDYSIRVRPAGGDATKDIANTYAGLIRNILNCSNFRDIRKEAFKEQCFAGLGAFRVLTDFLDPEAFEQDVRVQWIPDAVASVYFDPWDKDPLKRNSDYCFVVEDMDPETFKEMYPNSPLADVAAEPMQTRVFDTGWVRERAIRVAEYFKKTPVKKKLLQLSTGEVVFEEDVAQILDELAQQGVTVTNERMTDHYRIDWYKISGAEVLEGPTEWPGTRYIPVVPAYGYHQWIDGRLHFRGMVRHSKDPQRIYNYATSAMVEAAAKSPKDMTFVTPEQVGEHVEQYKNFNVNNNSFLMYSHQPDQPPPFKLPAPQVQSALIQQVQQADQDLQATIGRSAAALGNVNLAPGNTPSGQAVANIQKGSDLGQVELFANADAATEALGDILLDVIPRVYDTERQVRIIQPDGKDEFRTINQEVVDVQTGETVMFNDLHAGKYDLLITTGPSFQTQREQTFQMITQLAAADPMFMQMTADLLMQSIEHPLSEEFEKRARKQLLQQGLVEPSSDEEIQQAEASAQQMQAEAERARAIEDATIKAQLEQSETLVSKTLQEIVDAQVKNQKTMVEIDKLRADINKSLADATNDAMQGGGAISVEQLAAQSENLQLMLEKLDQGMTEIAAQYQAAQEAQRQQLEQYVNSQSEFLVDEEGNMYTQGPDGNPVPIQQ